MMHQRDYLMFFSESVFSRHFDFLEFSSLENPDKKTLALMLKKMSRVSVIFLF